MQGNFVILAILVISIFGIDGVVPVAKVMLQQQILFALPCVLHNDSWKAASYACSGSLAAKNINGPERIIDNAAHFSIK